MNTINFKKEINSNLENAIVRVTQVLKFENFGVLTRIDLHQKIKERLGKDVTPTVILGVCNPDLAYDAYQTNPDVTSLLPCNAVLREIRPGRVSVEFAKPTSMMEILGDARLAELAFSTETNLKSALQRL